MKDGSDGTNARSGCSMRHAEAVSDLIQCEMKASCLYHGEEDALDEELGIPMFKVKLLKEYLLDPARELTGPLGINLLPFIPIRKIPHCLLTIIINNRRLSSIIVDYQDYWPIINE